MKYIVNLIIVSVFFIFLTGMSSLSGNSPGNIPMPEKKFTATFIDQSDIATECRNVSIEGGTFISGKRGEGTFTIPFENLSSISFLHSEGRLKGLVKLRSGSSIELILKKDDKAYGRTHHGNYQIKLIDLQKMIMGGSLQKQG